MLSSAPEQFAFQKKLQDSLEASKRRNPAFSLRAFSRKLQISPAAVSEILNGKRRVSRDLASRLLDRLELTDTERSTILDLFPKKGKSSGLGQGKIKRTEEIGLDQFKTISQWFHYGILALSETRNFQSDPAWIARRLRIRESDARSAVERLERLGFLRRQPDGSLQLSAPHFSTPDDVANSALREAHFKNLELATRSLEEDAVEDRDFSSVTMAISPEKIPVAKAMIRKFTEQLSEYLESTEKTEVYKVCVQLFALTDLNKKPKEPTP
jgi:transcriptional regulator with XRE-family HTH domain